MAVSLLPDKLMGQICTVEVRFDEAYRYIDKCGEAMSRIRELYPRWVPQSGPTPEQGAMIDAQNQLLIRMSMDRFIMSKNADDWTPALELDKASEAISKQIDPILDIVYELFRPKNTVRLGSRYSFIIPTGALVDCEHFIRTHMKSNLQSAAASAFSSVPFSGHARIDVEDERTGFRRSVTFAGLARSSDPAAPGYHGFAKDWKSSSALQIDIDCYTRPDSGHFETSVGSFVRNAYSTARDGLTKIMNALR